MKREPVVLSAGIRDFWNLMPSVPEVRVRRVDGPFGPARGWTNEAEIWLAAAMLAFRDCQDIPAVRTVRDTKESFVRFQTTEIVPAGDVEQVLRALEASLRTISDRIERKGQRIVLLGLGPSPRAKNYRDTTVFDVISRNGSTTIYADVTFQASALLGVASQDAVVLGKLDHVYELIRAQLGLPEAAMVNVAPLKPRVQKIPEVVEELKTVAVPAVEEFAVPDDFDAVDEYAHAVFARAHVGSKQNGCVAVPTVAAVAEHVEEVPVAVSEATVEAAAEVVAETAEVAEPGIEIVEVAEAVEAVAPVEVVHIVREEAAPAAPVKSSEPIKVEEPVKVAEPVKIEEPVKAAEPVIAAAEDIAKVEVKLLPTAAKRPLAPAAPAAQPTVFAELASRIDSGVRRRAVFAPEHHEERAKWELPDLKLSAASASSSQRTGVPMLIVSLLAVAVSVGSVYLYWMGRLNIAFVRQMIARETPPQPVAAPPQPTVTQVQPPPPPPAPARHEQQNVKLWLEDWAEAIRGRDPDLQASFYADPVAEYLGESDLSAEDLTGEFRSAIQARDGLWTFKVENVSVNPQSPTDVQVRLTKHFMQLDDSSQSESNQIADKYVRSRLELRKMDGEWKIVSEQDVTPANASASTVSSRM
jgi:ketosteroid isomerase-like protein